MPEFAQPQRRLETTSQLAHARFGRHVPDVDSRAPFPAVLQVVGNQALQRLLRQRTIQAKLRIGPPGDSYEQEADRVADVVMRMPDPLARPSRLGPTLPEPVPDLRIQRMCAACQEEEEENVAQPKRVGCCASEAAPDVESRIEGLRGGGSPLPDSVRGFFESRFGYGFGDVRIHTDPSAAESAGEINALAYTLGRNIVFAPGQYAPGTTAGSKLLAHELTHVVQQTGSSASAAPAVQRQETGNLAVQRLVRTGGSDSKERQGRAWWPSMDFPYGGLIGRALETGFPLKGVIDADGCAARGTPAFTEGTVTHFATAQPHLHVAAHEAAHQLQHAGLSHDAGLGPEGHAQAVADTIGAGQSAADLVTTRGRPVSSAARNYTEVEGGRLGDLGLTWTSGGHEAYAVPSLISQAASALQGKLSGVTLSLGGGSREFTTPEGETNHLSRLKIELKADDSLVFDNFYEDCGRAAREVMGPAGDDAAARAVFKIGGELRETPAGALQKRDPREIIALILYIDDETRKIPRYEELSPERKAEKQKEIREKYARLSKAEKEGIIEHLVNALQGSNPELAARLGLDEHAEPEVGEAYTIRDLRRATTDEGAYHWAAVIMAAGPDRVTLENAAKEKDAYEKKNTLWKVQTYGPASKSQTFHDEWKGKFGDENAKTIRVRTTSQPPDRESIHAAVTSGDFAIAFKILNGQSMPQMLHTLDSGIASAILAHLSEAEGVNLPRIEVALSAVTTREVPDEAPGWASLPYDQKEAVRKFLGQEPQEGDYPTRPPGSAYG